MNGRASALVTATGLVLGWAADQVLGDPRRFHPVAGFGTIADRLEKAWNPAADSSGERSDVRSPRGVGGGDDRASRRAPELTRWRGVAYTATLVGGAAGLGWGLKRATSGHPVLATLTLATATWAVLGGRSLARESEAIAERLAADDLPGARVGVSHLVSRDPESLDADGVARATVESVAENTSDAVVAPLLWGAVAGIPGLLAYRAINTLDAMVGYRNQRFSDFGWASAKLDDLANWVPARVSGALAVVAAPLVGGDPAKAWQAVVEQSDEHPSPNGGVVEAAFAGALGVQLGGVNSYGGEVEDRGLLGYGPPPRPADVARANRLAFAVSAASLAVAAVTALLLRRTK